MSSEPKEWDEKVDITWRGYFNLFNEDGAPKQEIDDLLTDYREWMYWD